ncbi:MAG: sigma-70 family RNA polymerase sigma factor [Rhodothermales bacterium]
MSNTPSKGDVTQLINDWQAGKDGAADALFDQVYQELRRIARGYIARERQDHTITPTGLVNQACIKLLDDEHLEAKNRAHFFAIVATKMRHFLVDYARRHNAAKRNKGAEHEPFEDEFYMFTQDRIEEILALDEALAKLAKEDELQSKIVEMRYFGGYTQQEIAELLDISLKKTRREWYLAKAWLKEAISKG